jgi:hypothetical protein
VRGYRRTLLAEQGRLLFTDQEARPIRATLAQGAVPYLRAKTISVSVATTATYCLPLLP